MGAGNAVWGSALVLTLVLAGGCASTAGDGQGSAARSAATIAVANHNWADMNVYVLRNGARFRLGTVGTAESRTFRLPEGALMSTSGVHLLADPIGGARAHVSPSIQVGPGERIVWTIENSVALSSYRIERMSNW